MHKLIQIEKKRSKSYGFCQVCQVEVEAVAKARVGGGVVWRCLREMKAKAAKERAFQRKRLQTAADREDRQIQRRAEKMWRSICYARAQNRCEICGKECEPGVFGSRALHAHHIIKRSQSKRLLIDPANAMAVCSGCHQGADRDQVRCLAILEEVRPGVAAYLLKQRRIMGRRPFDEEFALLKAAADAIGDIEF